MMNKGFNKLPSGIFIEDRINAEDIEQIIKYKRFQMNIRVLILFLNLIINGLKGVRENHLMKK